MFSIFDEEKNSGKGMGIYEKYSPYLQPDKINENSRNYGDLYQNKITNILCLNLVTKHSLLWLYAKKPKSLLVSRLILAAIAAMRLCGLSKSRKAKLKERNMTEPMSMVQSYLTMNSMGVLIADLRISISVPDVERLFAIMAKRLSLVPTAGNQVNSTRLKA
jgi:hypothetical protein